jgi:hypothetical protein
MFERLRRLLLEKLNSDVTEEERTKVLAESVATLFNTIGKEDILRQEKGVLYFGNTMLSPEQIKRLRGEAQAFKNMQLFKVLDNEVRYHANKKAMEAVNLDQLTAAKMIQYTWDVLKSRLEI